MPRVVSLVLLLALSLAGCGSGGDAASAKNAPEVAESPSATPSATYFARADTDEINEVAARAVKVARVAQNQKRIDGCDARSSQGYASWRRCWHGLLDPFNTALASLASTLRDLGTRDFPAACKAELTRAVKTFTARAAVVSKLVDGIDSDQRADQVRSMRTYVPNLRKMSKTWTEPFQALTQACYSPEDLESINASPSPSPSPSG